MTSYKTKIMIVLGVIFAAQGIYADDVSYAPVYEKQKTFPISSAGIILEPAYEKISMRYPLLSEIQKRTTEIKRDFLIARIKQRGLQGLAAAGAVLAVYKLGHGGYHLWQQFNAPKVEPIQNVASVPSWQEVGPDIIEGMRRVNPPLLSFDWFKNMAGYGVDGFVMIVAGKILGERLNNYIAQDLFHPDHGSVKWFAGNKTSFLATMEELKQYVLVLDGPAIKSKQSKAMYDSFIISTINSMVIHVESIIGFIDYKQSFAPDDCAAQMAHISRYLFNITHQFCESVDQLLARDDIEPHERKLKMESMVNELRSEVARIVVAFARIEIEKGI